MPSRTISRRDRRHHDRLALVHIKDVEHVSPSGGRPDHTHRFVELGQPDATLIRASSDDQRCALADVGGGGSSSLIHACRGIPLASDNRQRSNGECSLMWGSLLVPSRDSLSPSSSTSGASSIASNSRPDARWIAARCSGVSSIRRGSWLDTWPPQHSERRVYGACIPHAKRLARSLQNA